MHFDNEKLSSEKVDTSLFMDIDRKVDDLFVDRLHEQIDNLLFNK